MQVSIMPGIFVLMIVIGLVFTSLMFSKRHGNRSFLLLLCLIPLFLVPGGLPLHAMRFPFQLGYRGGVSLFVPLWIFIVVGLFCVFFALLSQKHRHARVLGGIVLALIVFGFLTTVLSYHHIVPSQTRSTAWVGNNPPTAAQNPPTAVSWDSRQVPAIWSDGIDKQFQVDVNTASKPWVDNLSEYLNQHPHQNFAVAYSTDSCTTQAEAHQEALDNARQLLSQQTGNPAFLKAFDLENSDLIQDKFTQSLQGTTSKIWREALLLDLSPNKIGPLAQRYAIVRQTRHLTWARQLVSGLGLAFVLFLLYLFLNAATRGYYTVSLRIATAVLVAAGIAIVIWIV